MSDRELLGLAAKAAGIDYHATREDGTKCIHDGRGYWNPRDDDGDALRLAVKLGLTVAQLITSREVYVFNHEETVEVYEDYGTDPDAATRRAIFLAAAEIGRNMK
jgi:hypothetical protein